MALDEQGNILPKDVEKLLKDHASPEVRKQILEAFRKSKELDKLNEDKQINEMKEMINKKVKNEVRDTVRIRKKMASLSKKGEIEYTGHKSWLDSVGGIIIRIGENSLKVGFNTRLAANGEFYINGCTFDFSPNNIDYNTKMALLKNFDNLLTLFDYGEK